MQTWFHGDISANPMYRGDLVQALRAIKARAIVMPGDNDRYFPPVDNMNEVKLMKNAECRPIPSIWGHMTVWNPEDRVVIDQALRGSCSSLGRYRGNDMPTHQVAR